MPPPNSPRTPSPCGSEGACAPFSSPVTPPTPRPRTLVPPRPAPRTRFLFNTDLPDFTDLSATVKYRQIATVSPTRECADTDTVTRRLAVPFLLTDMDAVPEKEFPSRSSSEECGEESICVRVDDITSQESADDDSITDDVCVEAVEEPSSPIRKSQEMVEWPALAAEYSSSPVVQKELIQAHEEHRPRPPSLHLFDSTASTSFNVSANSSRRSSTCHSPPPTAKVTLLEKIVRTHPIWYLQHVGRSAATHLLRRMHPGAFIVRSSSRPNAMALSVRLPPGLGIDTDHYIIESDGRGRSVRLESSPYSFNSLPLLIQHYCYNGEELQVRLALAAVVADSTSTKQLQSIALMGQDFWTSEMSLPRVGAGHSHSRAASIGGSSTTSSTRSTGPPLQQHTHSYMTDNGCPVGQYTVDRTAMLTKKRPSSAREWRGRGGSETRGREGQPPADTPSPPSKHDRTDENDSARLSRSKDVRSASVRVSKAQGRDLSVGARGFLRKIFGSDSAGGAGAGAGGAGGGKGERAAIHQLAHCDYFIPVPAGTVKSSHSAMELERASEQLLRHANDFASTFKPQAASSSRKGVFGARRERSDLCASSALRIAQHTQGSPPPLACQPASPRVPLVPPKHALDGDAMKGCVESLRRKRLQTTDEMLGPVGGEREAEDVVVRAREWGWRARASPDHRLSVPNLSEPPANLSGKALQGRLRGGDGQLTTINEGLITPVIRRKQFGDANGNSLHDTVHSNSSGEEPVAGAVSRGRDALQALFESRAPLQQTMPSPSKDQLGRRYNSERSRSGQPRVIEREQTGSAQRVAKGTAWQAINSELKHRQKVAKVRPTPQQRHPMEGDRISEYAHLSELDRGDAASMKDDDAVSVAGTVFNEPWDSNVWENLLDLAHHGDEKTGRNLNAVAEEDSDSDRTAGSNQMLESEEEEEEEYGSLRRDYCGGTDWEGERRKIPSDHVVNKAWDDGERSKCGTLDSRRDLLSQTGTLGRRAHSPQQAVSMHSLPRALSRFSQQHMGSLDELPTRLPSLSPTAPPDAAGHAIQNYVEQLSQDSHTVFGATLARFIECTVESEETDPQVVVRNVRQFINGIKNYLVKHGEGALHELIEAESARLTADRILNIDALLEAVLHKILLRPIKPHLYHLQVKEQSRTGQLQALSANLAHAKQLTMRELGLADSFHPPTTQQMEQMKVCLRKMQHHYSPLKKLENLMRAIRIAQMASTRQSERVSPQKGDEDENADPMRRKSALPAADDLVRLLVFVLARTSTVGCEVEAWYMWELLPQQMLTSGDASFCLTALFSAVQVLKSADAVRQLADRDGLIHHIDMSMCAAASSSGDAFLRIAIPDEQTGQIQYATYPGVPQLTAGKLCRVVAHQQGITNPEDHGLYLLANGFETCLLASECPEAIRCKLGSQPHLFAYKRHEAKIAWPKQAMAASSSSHHIAA